MDNIAEGFERDGKREFIQFLSVSKSSASEIRSRLYRAFDRAHLNQLEFNELYKRADEIGKMIGGFMKYLRNSETKGLKFKASDRDPDYEL